MSQVFSSDSLVTNQSLLSIKNVLLGVLFGGILVVIGFVSFNYFIEGIRPTDSVLNFTAVAVQKKSFDKWQIYKNPTFQYSLKYPETINIYDLYLNTASENTSSVLLTNLSPTQNQNIVLKNIPTKSITMLITAGMKKETKYSKLSLEEIADQKYADNKVFSQFVSGLKKIEVGNVGAFKFGTKKSIAYSGIYSEYLLDNSSLEIIIAEKGEFLYEIVYKPTGVVNDIISTLDISKI